MLAALAAGVAFAAPTTTLWSVRPGSAAAWLSLPVAALLAAGMYLALTRRVRTRQRLRRGPFPREWETILERDVAFYRALEPAERERFRRELQIFLAEKRITGVGTSIDDETRVLAAASAVIPIFGFPDWEWEQIREILIYPTRFDEHYDFAPAPGAHTLGQVGSGAMKGMMILSKPDLIRGFRDTASERNVGIHEFAHLLDKSDGAIDGLPEVGLDRRTIGPWIDLVRREMARIRGGRSDIDPYGLTNEAEFFAVATEYFFKQPQAMREKHPELFAMLSRFFRRG